MNGGSRRRFLRSCLYASAGLSGLGSGLIALLLGGCRRQTTVETARAPVDAESGRRASARQAPSIAPDFRAAYLDLHETGELKKRADELWQVLESCRLCPRQCGVNRHRGEGFCHASSELEIAAHHPHFGEEASLVGRGGSGTVFFTNCSLRCVFCINYQISQEGQGRPRSIEDLADMMLDLQDKGCHNINLVTPTHYSPHILRAVDIAAGKGLRLPLVYNTCGWERLEILKQLDGIIDIYLPDFKYADGEMAAKYSSGADTYPEITKAALLEMHRQVGVARPAPDGLMYRGLMIRHLVMPNGVGGTKGVLDWIAANLPKDTYVNLMSQYQPMYKAFQFREISRGITREEYDESLRWVEEAGLTRVATQGRDRV